MAKTICETAGVVDCSACDSGYNLIMYHIYFIDVTEELSVAGPNRRRSGPQLGSGYVPVYACSTTTTTTSSTPSDSDTTSSGSGFDGTTPNPSESDTTTGSGFDVTTSTPSDSDTTSSGSGFEGTTPEGKEIFNFAVSASPSSLLDSHSC